MPINSAPTADIIGETFKENEGKNGRQTAEALREKAESIRSMQEDQRSAISSMLDKTADTLEKHAADVTLDSLEEGVGGQAYLGQEGSSVIDPTKGIQEDGTLDETFIKDVVKHEDEHEGQADDPNASALVIDGQRVTFHKDIVETGAMSVQTTVSQNSQDYQNIFATTTSFMSADEARSVARSGDMLGLAKDVAKKGHTVTVEG